MQSTTEDLEATRVRLRNQIQDEIFRASEQRCNAFKLYLQRIQSNSGFLGNSVAMVLGGLGGLFTDASVARSLSVAAGTTSGLTAQFNESYFFSLTVPVISDGIDNARSVIHNQAMQARFDDKGNSIGTGKYTLQAAILDAVRFDGACSIPEGLRAAGEAVKAIRNPGPDVLERAINQYNAIYKKLNQTSGETGGARAVSAPQIATPTGSGAPPQTPPVSPTQTQSAPGAGASTQTPPVSPDQTQSAPGAGAPAQTQTGITPQPAPSSLIETQILRMPPLVTPNPTR